MLPLQEARSPRGKLLKYKYRDTQYETPGGAVLTEKLDKSYLPFIADGKVWDKDKINQKRLNVLRDTGAAHSLARRKDILAKMRQKTGKIKTIIGIGGKPLRTEIYKIKLESKW